MFVIRVTVYRRVENASDRFKYTYNDVLDIYIYYAQEEYMLISTLNTLCVHGT